MSFITMEKKPPKFKQQATKKLYKTYDTFCFQLDKIYRETGRIQDEIENLIDRYGDKMDKLEAHSEN